MLNVREKKKRTARPSDEWDQAIDSEEVVTPLMLDGTYLSRNFADWLWTQEPENFDEEVKSLGTAWC